MSDFRINTKGFLQKWKAELSSDMSTNRELYALLNFLWSWCNDKSAMSRAQKEEFELMVRIGAVSGEFKSVREKLRLVGVMNGLRG